MTPNDQPQDGAGDAVVTSEDWRADRNAYAREGWDELPPKDAPCDCHGYPSFDGPNDPRADPAATYTVSAGTTHVYYPRLLTGASITTALRRATSFAAQSDDAWAEVIADRSGRVVYLVDRDRLIVHLVRGTDRTIVSFADGRPALSSDGR